MSSFQWRKAYALSIPLVDTEHRSLFRLGASLHRAIESRGSLRNLAAACNRLAVHTEAHFRHEESEMKAARYPLQQWHRRQHAGARARVGSLAGSIRRGDREAAAGELQSLCRVLRDHILLADRMWAAHVRRESLLRRSLLEARESQTRSRI